MLPFVAAIGADYLITDTGTNFNGILSLFGDLLVLEGLSLYR
jgi:hypothetical protein